MPPVLPPQFRELIVLPTDSLAVAIFKTFVRLPYLWWKYFAWKYNPDGSLSLAYCQKVRAAVLRICPPTPPEEEE